MNRLTEDGHWLFNETALVWEIMWQYVNPEVSIAYAEKRPMCEIPPDVRVWKRRNRCVRECRKLNRKRSLPLQKSYSEISALITVK
jgi:hypothetical protein